MCTRYAARKRRRSHRLTWTAEVTGGGGFLRTWGETTRRAASRHTVERAVCGACWHFVGPVDRRHSTCAVLAQCLSECPTRCTSRCYSRRSARSAKRFPSPPRAMTQRLPPIPSRPTCLHTFGAAVRSTKAKSRTYVRGHVRRCFGVCCLDTKSSLSLSTTSSRRTSQVSGHDDVQSPRHHEGPMWLSGLC